MVKVQNTAGSSRAQPAHLEDVVLVGQRLDDHAGGEEEQGLEEGVRHEVEDARLPAGDAERQEHVADLADRRVGERALEVVLHQRAEARQQQRHRADDGDDEPGVRRQREEHVGARDEVDAGGDHGRGVDERADRRRAGHGVREPRLQRHLRRLADGAAEDEQGGGDGHGRAGHEAVLRRAPASAGSAACAAA